MPTHAVQVYRCLNLGDMIQTLALTRLLPPALGVFRHRLGEHPPGCLVVLNGFLHRDRPPLGGERFLFAGVSGPHWRRGQYLRWMRSSAFPIGARDPATRTGLAEAGLRSELVGCATLTFPRYDGPRHGVYSVDCDGPGTRLTHAITRRMDVSAQPTRQTYVDLLARRGLRCPVFSVDAREPRDVSLLLQSLLYCLDPEASPA